MADLKIQLEEECRRCYGSGKTGDKDKVVDCDSCKGKGSRPTEFGQEILDFVKKYGAE
jgi:DnaJ-class molecular chaperone